MTSTSERVDKDQVLLDAEQIEEQAECYCGLGPECPLWRALTPEERIACSLDKRAVAQAFWINGM